jgi:hypothetical protein
MAGDEQRGALFRPLIPNQRSRVTYAELFFDLVFAFAVTQISHTLLSHFTPLGALQTTLLFLGIWWLWVYTAWITNWLNPELDRISVAGGAVLDSEIRRLFGCRLGGRRRPHGRALRRFYYHRARRIHRRDRCHLCRSELDHGPCHGLRVGPD